MRTTGLTCLLLASALLPACGGDDDDDDNGSADAAVAFDSAPAADATPAGPGLLIEGSLIVDNRINSEVNSNHRVNADIWVSRDGAPVTNAIIRVEPPGAFETFLTGEPLEPSRYTGNYMNYTLPQTRIEISADDDLIPETVIVGMELFKILTPSPGSTQPPDVDLATSWSRPGAAADSLVVTTAGSHDSGSLADADMYTIPGADITLATTDDRILVTRCRRNDTLPGDAAEGSYIDFCVRSELPFTVAE